MKTTLDSTDAEILRALVDDGRRAYSDIADEVDMSTPAVIERVERLRDKGVIEGFEARLDPSVLGGTRLLVRFRVSSDETSTVSEALADDDRVNTVFVSADATVTVVADAEPDEAVALLGSVGAYFGTFEVEVVVDEEHAPTVRQPSFAPDCVECGNTVDKEGVTARVAGDIYHFCCTSCESAFRDRYGEL
jgi:DNA-binding Lrp family transcriptional regulator